MNELKDDFIRLKNLQQKLKELKAEETKLRKQLATGLKIETLKIGVNKIEIDNLAIVATRKVSYSVDKDDLESIWESLSDEEKDAINWKPSLALKVYKGLADTEMLDECIEVKPAMPSITVNYIGE